MNIAYIASVRIPNEKASGLAIMRQCEAFAQLQHRVTLLRPNRRNHISDDPFEYYGIKKIFDIKTMYSINFIEPLGLIGFYLARVSQMLASVMYVLIHRKSIDLLYARDPWMLVLPAVVLRNKKLIWEAHQKQSHFLLKMMAKRVTRIFCISSGLVDFYTAYTQRDDILLEPSGVELTQFEHVPPKKILQERFGIPVGRKVIGYIGKYSTMGESKGVDELISAFGEVLKKQNDAHLLLAGLEEKEIPVVRLKCAHAGVPGDRVTLLPLVQKDFAQYVHSVDVLVMNYPNTEHYRDFMSPTKLFAYMASGKLVVASDLPSIRKIADEQTALFVEADSVAALSSGLYTDLTLSDIDYNAYVSNARLRVVPFSWSERGKRILKVTC